MSRNNYSQNGRNRYRSSSKKRYYKKNRNSSRSKINENKFIKKAEPNLTSSFKPINQFADFNVHETLKDNIKKKGFKNPTQIQDSAIPHILNEKDVIGIAGTGTGKTAAFAIPVLNKLILNKNSSVLVIAPTRELAQQINNEFRQFADNTKVYSTLIMGGTSMKRQLNELKRNPQVIIGTPGRTIDHVKRGTLRLQNFDTVVLDEVDRMADMGFIKDIRFLLGKLSDNRQSLVFSATLNRQIEGLVNSFLRSPVKIDVKVRETSSNIEQDVIRYQRNHERDEKLHKLLKHESVEKTLIFRETKRNVEKLRKELREKGHKVDAIHGDKSQNQRKRALDGFRNNHTDVLVATNVAARGIDVPDITHVINYDTPENYEEYIHRIGRTGRGNNIGYALTFVSQR